MEMWAWLLAYVVGFGLLQLVLYRYFRGGRGTPDSATPRGGDAGSSAAGGRADIETTNRVTCPHCGAPNANEATFSYCRACAESLG